MHLRCLSRRVESLHSDTADVADGSDYDQSSEQDRHINLQRKEATPVLPICQTKIMILYLLTNRANGKKYVGKTVRDNLSSYFSVKRWQAAHGNPSRMPVVAAIAKYGWESFSFEELARVTTVGLLNALEKQWIADLGTRDPEKGYNICEGGDVGRLGVRTSEDTKRKIGCANQGRKPKGYVRTEGHRSQLRDRMKGNTIGVKITSEMVKSWAQNMTPEQRRERAQKAAAQRWNKEGT